MPSHPLYEQKTYRCDAMAVRPEYRDLMLLHVDYLRNHPGTRTVPVDIAQRNLNLYDFYRYLSSIGYPAELHWVIMLVNDMQSHLEFDHTVTELIYPDPTAVMETLAMSGII